MKLFQSLPILQMQDTCSSFLFHYFHHYKPMSANVLLTLVECIFALALSGVTSISTFLDCTKQKLIFQV